MTISNFNPMYAEDLTLFEGGPVWTDRVFSDTWGNKSHFLLEVQFVRWISRALASRIMFDTGWMKFSKDTGSLRMFMDQDRKLHISGRDTFPDKDIQVRDIYLAAYPEDEGLQSFDYLCDDLWFCAASEEFNVVDNVWFNMDDFDPSSLEAVDGFFQSLHVQVSQMRERINRDLNSAIENAGAFYRQISA